MPASGELVLTRGEIADIMERESQRRYGMTAAELLGRYAAGDSDRCDGSADILALAGLLEPDDPLSLER